MNGYGHGGSKPISTQSLLLTSSLVKTDGRSSHCIADKSKTPHQSVFNTHNDFYLNKDSSTPDTMITLPPTAYTSQPIPSPLTLLDLKHHPYHSPCDNCLNGWEFDNNLINTNNITTPNDTTTDIFAYDNQSVRWGFDNKFIFDLKAKKCHRQCYRCYRIFCI